MVYEAPPTPEDPTNPDHYKGLLPQPITVIEGWQLGYLLGTVVKYISRAGRKTADGTLDLQKARWFLDRAIAAAQPVASEQPTLTTGSIRFNARRSPPTYRGQTEHYDGVAWVGEYASGIYYWTVA